MDHRKGWLLEVWSMVVWTMGDCGEREVWTSGAMDKMSRGYMRCGKKRILHIIYTGRRFSCYFAVVIIS